MEISRTDSFVLKVKPPVRESGDVKGSAPITIVGPKRHCIGAGRLHHRQPAYSYEPADGAAYGLKDGDYVVVEAEGERRTRFYDVQIRVSDQFVLEMHVDTDDANAAGLGNGAQVRIVQEK